ncbi:MAG: O-antigen ligase family protein [Anaerolineae bacterium]|nr:O-antigen ligase family protein [Anaerolineae bacterium]
MIYKNKSMKQGFENLSDQWQLKNQGTYSPLASLGSRASDAVSLLQIGKIDLLFIGITFVLCFLYFHRGFHTAYSRYVIIFLSVFAFLNPFSAVLYLAASQTMINPIGIPFTPAQLSVIGFCAALLTKVKRLSSLLESLGALLAYLLPFLFLTGAKRVLIWNNLPLSQDDIFMYAAALMIISYYKEAGKKTDLWLLCLAMGALIGIAGWFFNTIGLEATVEEIAGLRSRLFIGRAANATNIGLVAGSIAVLSLWIKYSAAARVSTEKRASYWLLFLFLGLLGAGTMSVFANGSRGGVISLFIAAVFTLLVSLLLFGTQIARYAVILVILSGLLFFIPTTGVRSSLQSMQEFNSLQAVEYDLSNPLLAGRYNAWVPALQSFLASPLLGELPWQQSSSSSEIGTHNVFLGMARGFGIFGLIAYCWYFFGPTYILVRSNGLRAVWPFVCVLLAFFLGFNSLGFTGYKTFHAFNGIVIGLVLWSKAKFSPQRQGYQSDALLTAFPKKTIL